MEGVKWALRSGHVVEIDVRSELREDEEGLEAFLTKVYEGNEEAGERGSIVLCECCASPSHGAGSH